MFVAANNPAVTNPNTTGTRAGLAREDLFTVVLEQFQTDTADYADIVLPATTQLEHFDIHKSYGHTYVLANNPAIAPLGEAKPNSDNFKGIDTIFSYDPSDFVLTAFQRYPGGSARGDYEEINKIRNLFFTI